MGQALRGGYREKAFPMIKVCARAREQGKVRFIGFTGHRSPQVHLKMLRQDYSWNTVQMPVNIMDAHFQSFAGNVVPLLQADD